MTGSARLRVWLGAPAIWVLAGCVSKGDIQRVQDDVALFKAETARRDSVRAAQLNEVIRVQQRIMDSLTSSRRAVGQLRGDLASDLYNIQQQLVQLQELTGQSQQRLSELRTQLEARGEQISSTTPGDTSAPPPAASNASADQMYEASLAQLRRGSTSTARQGLREMLRTYPTSARAGDALYFIGQSFAPRTPTPPPSTTTRWSRSIPRRVGPRRRSTTSAWWPSGVRKPGRPGRPTSVWFRSIPNPTKRPWLAID